MSEPIYAVVNDTQKKKQVIFDISRATISMTPTHADIVTDQGVKIHADVNEVLMILKAAEIAVMQVTQAEPEAPALDVPQVEEAPNVEV